MQAKELREKYLRFFEGKGHRRIPSASLIPENDPTVLFTTAGMHPLVPYLLGESHSMGKRVCNSQKCIRTGDIDDVGDATHLTFFEMLGNWSFGDPSAKDGIGAGYFKKEAIEWSFEFLTKNLGMSLDKLAFSVFDPSINSGQGQDISRDEEAYKMWQALGVSKERIVYLGRDDNWWGPAGNTGPCGPDTEMFYWTGDDEAPKVFNATDKNWVEIWNNVFMQYEKKLKSKNENLKSGDYEFVPLKQKNVDTGMGLERVAAILQGKKSVYETELFAPIIDNLKSKIENLKSESKILNLERERAMRIVADHIKAATFLLAEKLTPSNTERGYVLRRLIRRAVRYGKLLGIEQNFLTEVAKTVVEIYQDVYPELLKNQTFIFDELTKEEENFQITLEQGLKFLRKNISSYKEHFSNLSFQGGFAFSPMYESYGFPPELTLEELKKDSDIKIDEKAYWEYFNKYLLEHQNLSRTASSGQFKSGLADNSEQTTKYHTATHLLLAALRQILGEDIQQKGSNITAERIRFDFNFERKLTQEEIKKIENLINEQIKMALPVVCCEMETKKAFDSGATGVFGHKYPEKVKVYSVGGEQPYFSKEICAGPHVDNVSQLGEFKIIKEEASSAGVRRIKAILI